MAKLDKRKFVERLAEEAEEAAGRQDVKTLNNGFRNNDVHLKDTDGNVLSKEAEKLARLEGTF